MRLNLLLKSQPNKWPSMQIKAATNYVRRNDFLTALLIVLVVIAVGIVFSVENNKLIPQNPSKLAHYSREPTNKLSFLANWDGADYIKIIRTGYRHENRANFFPLYPLVAHEVKIIVRSPLDSALAVSWASFVGAVYFYIKIIKKKYKFKDNLDVIQAVLFFVLYPTAVFLFAAYTESLLAFLSLAALYFALERRWLVSSLFVMFATATHETGLLVLGLVALVLFEEKRRLATLF